MRSLAQESSWGARTNVCRDGQGFGAERLVRHGAHHAHAAYEKPLAGSYCDSERPLNTAAKILTPNR